MQASGQTGAIIMSAPATAASLDNASKQAGVRKPYTITKQRERWTDDEHARFLEALRLHGRTWRKIEEHIGTKSAVQIRSHAQKFFSKVERKRDTGCSTGAGVEEPGVGDPFSIPPPRPKRKPSRLDSGKADQLGGSFQDYDDCNDDENNIVPQQQLQPPQQQASHNQYVMQHVNQLHQHQVSQQAQHLLGQQQEHLARQQAVIQNSREAAIPARVDHHTPALNVATAEEEAYTRQQHAHLASMMMHAAQQHMQNLSQQQMQPSHHHNPHREHHGLQHGGYDAAMLHHQQQQQHHLHHPSREQHNGPTAAQLNHHTQQQTAQHTANDLASEVNEATVAMVAAAASAAAAAAAAAVVAAAGLQVQAHLQAHPPAGFPFFGVPPSLLAQVTLANPALEVFSSGYGGVLQQFLTVSDDQAAPSTREQAPSVRGQQQMSQRTTLAEAMATSDIGDLSLSLDLPNSRDSDGDSGNATSRKNDSWGRTSGMQQQHGQQQQSQQLSQPQHGLNAFMAANASSEAWAGLTRPLGGTLPSPPSLWDLLPAGMASGPTPEVSNDAHFRQLLFAGMQQANAGSWNAGQADRPLGFGRTASSNDGSGRRLSSQPWPDLISQGTEHALKLVRDERAGGGGFTAVSNGWDGTNHAATVQPPPATRIGDSPGHAESNHPGQQSPSPPPQDVATDPPMAALHLNPNSMAGPGPNRNAQRAGSDDTDRRDSNLLRHPAGQPPVKKQKSQATGNDAAVSAREAQASNLNHRSTGVANPSTHPSANNDQGSNRSPHDDDGSPTEGGGGGSCERGSDGSNSCGNGSCDKHKQDRSTKQGDMGASGHPGTQQHHHHHHHRSGGEEHKGFTGHRGQQPEAAASVRDSTNGSAGDGVSGNLLAERSPAGALTQSHHSHHAPHGMTNPGPASQHTQAHGSRNGHSANHHPRHHGHGHSHYTTNTASASPSLATNGSTHGSNNNVRAQQSAAGPMPLDLSCASRHNHSHNQQVHASSRLQASQPGSGVAGGLPGSNSSADVAGDAARCSSDDNSLLQLLNNSDMLTCMRDGSLQAMMDAMNARQGTMQKQVKQQLPEQLSKEAVPHIAPAEHRPSSVAASQGSQQVSQAASDNPQPQADMVRALSVDGRYQLESLSSLSQQQQQLQCATLQQQQQAVSQQAAVQQLQQQQQEHHMAFLRAAAIHEYNATLMQQQQHTLLAAGLDPAVIHSISQQQQQQQQMSAGGKPTSSSCHSVQPLATPSEQLQQKAQAALTESARATTPVHAFSSPPSFHTDSGISSFSCGAVVGGGSTRGAGGTSCDAELSSSQKAAAASVAAAAALPPLTSLSKRPLMSVSSQGVGEQGVCGFPDLTPGVQSGTLEAGEALVPALGMVKCSSMLKLIEAASNSQEGSLLRVAVISSMLT